MQNGWFFVLLIFKKTPNQDVQTCPECVRKNCSDKPWCNFRRSGSFGNDAHMQSRAKTHQVAVSGGSSDRIFQTCHCHFLSPLSPGKDASRLLESAGFVCHRPLSTWTAIGLPKLGYWYFEARCVLMMTIALCCSPCRHPTIIFRIRRSWLSLFLELRST